MSDWIKTYLKLADYCNYQERCTNEVWGKLAELNCDEEDKQLILHKLKSENLLDDLRYSCAYARGKFYLKNWGKQKIKYHLKKKGITNSQIIKGLEEIKEDDYLKTIEKLILQKKNLAKLGNTTNDKSKLYRYLVQKGYESDLILDYINNNR